MKTLKPSNRYGPIIYHDHSILLVYILFEFTLALIVHPLLQTSKVCARVLEYKLVNELRPVA